MGESEQPEQQQRVYPPHQVAARLQVSGAALRRMAAAYERAVGELPRDERGRVWPEEAVERLERARAAVHAGQHVSTEQALRAGDSPEAGGGRGDVPEAPARPVQGDIVALLQQLVAGQQGLAERLASLEEENRQLRQQLGAGGPTPQQLEEAGGAGQQEGAPPEPAPEQEQPTPRPWWRRLLGR